MNAPHSARSSLESSLLLVFRSYVFRKSFQGKDSLQALNSLWLFLVSRCEISFELVVQARHKLLASYNTAVSEISRTITKPVYLF